MRRRNKKTSIGIIGMFVLAFLLSFLAIQILPVPGEFQQLVFFLLVPAISGLGVLTLSKTKRR